MRVGRGSLLLLIGVFVVSSFAFPIVFDGIDDALIDRAKLLAKYSSIAYCSENKVLNWNCKTCQESLLTNFTSTKFLYGEYDTQGYMGYDDSVKTIYIVFQGSASIENWFANLQLFKLDYDYPGVSGARVHSGFYKSAKSLFDGFKSELQNLLSQKPSYKLTITGHSQGGANAIMTALFIRDEMGIEPEVQTFGEPRVGNEEYANYWKSRINQNALRFTHKRDPVPQLPPTWIGFHHHPREVFLQDGHGGKYTICDDSGEDPDCQNSIVFPIDIFDHLWYLDIYLGIPCS